VIRHVMPWRSEVCPECAMGVRVCGPEPSGLWTKACQIYLSGFHGHGTLHQIGREGRQSIEFTLCQLVFDRDVAAVDVPRLGQDVAECDQKVRVRIGGALLRKPITRYARRLLRLHLERPTCRRAAEKR
jgi:hypothetical protein